MISNQIINSEEFVNLIGEMHKKGMTRVWTGKKEFPDLHALIKIFNAAITKFLKDDVNRMAWKASRRLCLNMLFQNSDVGKFLDTCIK